MNCLAFLAVKISIEKSSIILRDCPLHMDYVGFFLVAFNTLFLLYLLRILSGICHVIAFVYLMFGFLYSFIFKNVAFLSLGKFSLELVEDLVYVIDLGLLSLIYAYNSNVCCWIFCLIVLVCYFPF